MNSQISIYIGSQECNFVLVISEIIIVIKCSLSPCLYDYKIKNETDFVFESFTSSKI